MCRLLALVFSRVVDEYLLDTILESFTLSNEYDPYLERASRGKSRSHDDGWGLAIAGLVDGQPVTAYYKSLEPIFYESSRRMLKLFSRKIRNYQPLYLVLHARKASAREPYGLDYVHPFMRLSDSGAAWFVHNGGADKKALAEKLGVYPWLRVDSELLGHYVMDQVLSCAESEENIDTCVVEAYSEAKNYVASRSALNTALLVLFKDMPYLYITHWLRELHENDLRDYYAVIAYKGEHLVFAGSISIREYAPRNILSDIHVLEPGVYRLAPGHVVKVSNL